MLRQQLLSVLSRRHASRDLIGFDVGAPCPDAIFLLTGRIVVGGHNRIPVVAVCHGEDQTVAHLLVADRDLCALNVPGHPEFTGDRVRHLDQRQRPWRCTEVVLPPITRTHVPAFLEHRPQFAIVDSHFERCGQGTAAKLPSPCVLLGQDQLDPLGDGACCFVLRCRPDIVGERVCCADQLELAGLAVAVSAADHTEDASRTVLGKNLNKIVCGWDFIHGRDCDGGFRQISHGEIQGAGHSLQSASLGAVCIAPYWQPCHSHAPFAVRCTLASVSSVYLIVFTPGLRMISSDPVRYFMIAVLPDVIRIRCRSS